MKPAELLKGFPISETAKLFSQKIIDLDSEEGWIKVSFLATDSFRNPAGSIQGGILTAMLDDTMGPALWIKGGGKAFPTTLDLNVSFFSPARPGLLYGHGKVLQFGKTIAFAEAQLSDETGRLIARSTSTARMITGELPLRST